MHKLFKLSVLPLSIALISGCCDKENKLAPYSYDYYSKLAVYKHNANAEYNLYLIYKLGIGVSKNEAQALKWLNAASAQKYPPAKLDDKYYYGKDGIFELTEEADKGNAKAAYELGMEYYKDVFLGVENPRATYWLTKSAAAGNINAQAQLGAMYNDLEPPKYESSIEFYQACADNNDDKSNIMKAQSCKEDKTKIESEFKKYTSDNELSNKLKSPEYRKGLAESNNAKDLFSLGQYYAEQRQYIEAQKYYDKAIEIGGLEKDQKTAAYENYVYIGQLYQFGVGREVDFNKAKEFYAKAAKGGNAPSSYSPLGDRDKYSIDTIKKLQNELDVLKTYPNDKDINLERGLIYFQMYREYIYVTKSPALYEEMVRLLTKSSELGVTKSANMLGNYYLFGNKQLNLYRFLHNFDTEYTEYTQGRIMPVLTKVSEENLQKAIRWFKKGVEGGDAYAMLNLAYLYQIGAGVKQDTFKADELLIKSANKKNRAALLILGNLSYQGISMPLDYETARETYTQYINGLNKNDFVSQMKSMGAFVRLGNIYYQGLGSKPNYQKALEVFTKGSKFQKGSPSSYYLAKMYENGQGTPVDYMKALALYKSLQTTNFDVFLGEGYDLSNLDVSAIKEQKSKELRPKIIKQLKEMTKKAKNGDQEIQRELARRYLAGEINDCVNETEYLYWENKLADEGNKDVINNLIKIYKAGEIKNSSYISSCPGASADISTYGSEYNERLSHLYMLLYNMRDKKALYDVAQYASTQKEAMQYYQQLIDMGYTIGYYGMVYGLPYKRDGISYTDQEKYDILRKVSIDELNSDQKKKLDGFIVHYSSSKAYNYEKENDLNQALEYYKIAQEYNKDSWASRYDYEVQRIKEEIKKDKQNKADAEYKVKYDKMVQGVKDNKPDAIIDMADWYTDQQKYDKAMELLIPLANKGNLTAKYHLSQFYLGYPKDDVPYAIKLLKEAANGGIYLAMDTLSRYYFQGRGVEQSDKIGFEWSEKSAQGDCASCVYNLALIYWNGLVVTQDDKKATELFQKAINMDGLKEAEYMLGYAYMNGYGVEKNTSKATELYKSSSMQGDSKASLALAIYYYENNVNVAEANDLLEQISRDYFENYYIQAQASYYLGLMYLNGVYYDKSKRQAFLKFDYAASIGGGDKSYACVDTSLADIYLGDESYKDAKKWYEMALKDKNNFSNKAKCKSHAKDQLEVVNRVLDKILQEKQEKEARDLKLYETALGKAKDGNVNSMVELAGYYADGSGTKADLQQALYWYDKAISKGNGQAYCDLGKLYYNGYDGGKGNELKKDDSKALDYYNKALKLGNKCASTEIGSYYYLNNDYKKAYSFAFTMISLGNPNGAQLLAMLFDKGQGVIQNKQLAAQYYLKAIEMDSPHMDIIGPALQKILPKLIDGYQRDEEKPNDDLVLIYKVMTELKKLNLYDNEEEYNSYKQNYDNYISKPFKMSGL